CCSYRPTPARLHSPALHDALPISGHMIFMLCLVAVICLILGMGMPTTASYIVVSALMAPVVVELGAESGLVVPLVAVHMFVFYRSEEHTSEPVTFRYRMPSSA